MGSPDGEAPAASSYSMNYANASGKGGFGGPHSGYEMDAIGPPRS
jgi:hypothetical protein